MKPEFESKRILGVTQSKAKMYEYSVPETDHITIVGDPARLLRLSIGMLGDIADATNRLQDQNAAMTQNTNFSAQFFDAYYKSRLNSDLDEYLQLIGSSTYYLCGLPGSSAVLAHGIDPSSDLQAGGIETVLIWILQATSDQNGIFGEGFFAKILNALTSQLIAFYEEGLDESLIFDTTKELRRLAYLQGTPRQLLFADVLSAVVRRKVLNSCRHSLPIYSKISEELWKPFLKNRAFIKELWPSQHLLGEKGVLAGMSAVLQMPTSAGKTKATELIIRSSFLANRTKTAVIVAPFRALCHEIRQSLNVAFKGETVNISEISSVLQVDFELAQGIENNQILVMTPEKLLYALRHDPSPAADFGLIIFDEAHQFDSGTRGITYELLLTSLKRAIPDNAQKILISAVMENARAVGDWLNGVDSQVVAGTNLIPTLRSIGFASWKTELGRIEYVSNDNPEKGEYFVPRVIEVVNLLRKPRERTTRQFPEKNNGSSIALYLGLNLVKNGSVAIFCGTKVSAASVCQKVVDLDSRGYLFSLPKELSRAKEIERLRYLYERNLGEESVAAKSAALGVFSHHGNIPHGIRLSVEYAMRKGSIRFVVCTSTLAQGVNLPIRYLIVTSVYQGGKRIKVRDFHNLMGRVGRAGMHTEGSVLFADSDIYDRRKTREGKWRWNEVKHMLRPSNSEPCISNLLSLFEPFKNGSEQIDENVAEFISGYINNRTSVEDLSRTMVERNVQKELSLEAISSQVGWKINLIGAVESFLLANWDLNAEELNQNDAVQLAQETLAYFLADDIKRSQIQDLFVLLTQSISQNLTDSRRRKAYAKTLLNIREAGEVELWVTENIDALLAVANDTELLLVVWPFLMSHIRNNAIRKCDKPELLTDVVAEWIKGTPFYEILSLLTSRGARLRTGKRKRDLKIDDMVDLCEGGFGFEAALFAGAIQEFLPPNAQDNLLQLSNRLTLFQKQLTYGLPSLGSIRLYEMGFSDRCVAQDLEQALSRDEGFETDIVSLLRKKGNYYSDVLEEYPAYFRNRLKEV